MSASDKKSKDGAGRTRSSEAAQRKVIDNATRKRRQKKQLEVLESDNFHDDPHNSLAQLSSKAKLPTFAETSDGRKRKKTRSNADHFKQRFRKTFQTLLEELPPEAHKQPSYITAVVPPSVFPAKHFCAVCGFPSNYTCVTCGARYCSASCLRMHQDTRCLKWTA